MRMFHGSPFGAIKTFKNIKHPIFLTLSKEVAREYAVGEVLNAQKLPDGVTSTNAPTIYVVEVKLGDVIDFRQSKVRELYSRLRNDALRLNDDYELRHDYPKIEASGFLSTSSGLPSYEFWRPIKKIFSDAGFTVDGIWLDEGSQGASLVYFQPNDIEILEVHALKNTVEALIKEFISVLI